MKKYTIKDNFGNKKTIYANSLSDAIKFVDSKLKDVSLTTGDWFTLRNERDAAIYKIVSVSHSSYVTDVYRVEADFGARRTFIKKIGSKSFYTSNVRGRDDITTLAVKFNSAEEAVDWLKKQSRLASSMLFKKNNSIHDEASLATSINALVTDEKAAIDAYNVAINNLKGKIDDNAMQVLINIMKDERKHVENLYAILNNQVTEKNLEDSKLKDSKFYVGISEYDYTKEQAEKDARKFGLQLKIVGKSSDPNIEYDAYLIGPRSNILKMLKANDMEDFEEDIED